jgi:hypothetical protein
VDFAADRTDRTGASDCYDGAIAHFRPGKKLAEMTTNANGYPVADADTVEKGVAIAHEGSAGAETRQKRAQPAQSGDQAADRHTAARSASSAAVCDRVRQTEAGLPFRRRYENMKEHNYLLSIDGPQFREQRELLIRLCAAARTGRPCELGLQKAELLEGLVNLTDAVADQAHDRYGIDCLLD